MTESEVNPRSFAPLYFLSGSLDIMDGWRDILHFDFHGEHVLFSFLRLSSGFNFLTASLLTILLCACEKYLSYVSLKSDLQPRYGSRLANAAFRAAIYWLLTFIRLLYMLLAMTFHVGLIMVVVTTLSVGQFIIEYLGPPQASNINKGRTERGLPFARNDLENPPEHIGLLRVDDAGDDGASANYPRKITARESRTHSGGNGSTVFAIDDDDATI